MAHANLQRLAVLRLPQQSEECVLAMSEGPVPGVVDSALIGPNDFVAMISFTKLGPGFWRTEADGNPCWIMPVLDEPTTQKSRWFMYETASAALAVLQAEKAKLLALGWLEGSHEPVNDPD